MLNNVWKKTALTFSVILFLSIFIPIIGFISVVPALILSLLVSYSLCINEECKYLKKTLELSQTVIIWCPFVQLILLLLIQSR